MADPTHIYRITHVTNLPVLLSDGGIHCAEEFIRKDKPYLQIGYKKLTRKRGNIEVPCGPKGTLANYVPFYFCPRSPMLGSIAIKRQDTYGGGQEDVVHIVSSVESVLKEGLDFAFTDRHAKISIAKFYDDPAKLSELDWDVIRSWKWKTTPEDPDRMERKQAEFLVYKYIPWNLVQGIGVHNSGIRDSVRAALKEHGYDTKVKVMSKWYYN